MQSIRDQQNQTLNESDDAEIHLHVTYARHFDMDEAFCAHMLTAIEAGLENTPIGVVTRPGTNNPKYIPTQQVVAFSQGVDLSKTNSVRSPR
jgi:hypothetical protein